MTAEYALPKSGGDVFYASEANAGVELIQAEAGENLTAFDAVFIKETDGKVYTSDTSIDANKFFDGIVLATTTSGNTATVQMGGTVPGMSGLTANEVYYVSTGGDFTTTRSQLMVGKAISTTALKIIKRPNDWFAEWQMIGTIPTYSKPIPITTSISEIFLSAFHLGSPTYTLYKQTGGTDSTIIDSFDSIDTNLTGADVNANGDLCTISSSINVVHVYRGFSTEIINSFAVAGGNNQGLCFDSDNNCIHCDPTTNLIYKQVGMSETLGSSIAAPATEISGVGIDSAGNLATCDAVSNKIYIHSGFSTTITTSFAGPSTNPVGVAFDADDNLISVDNDSDKIYIHSGSTSTITTSFATAEASPSCVGFDGAGIIDGESSGSVYLRGDLTSVGTLTNNAWNTVTNIDVGTYDFLRLAPSTNRQRSVKLKWRP